MVNICNRLSAFFRSILEAPVPHNSIEVHRTLLTIYRIHLVNLFLSLPALLLHTTILTYSLVKEERCDKPFVTWLFIVASLTAARIIPQCILIARANTLLSEWIVRPVAYETSLLVKSLVAQSDRILWIVSFVWFLIGFEWAYKSLTCNALSPVLYQYITVLILFFLAMIGMNCVLCMGSSTMLLLACLVPSERFVQLFEDYRRGNHALPSHALKRMRSVEWKNEMRSNSFLKMCPICLGEYEEGHSVRQLPCNHWFHQTCIDQWFRSNSTCPLRCHVNMITGNRLDSRSSRDSLISGRSTACPTDETTVSSSPYRAAANNSAASSSEAVELSAALSNADTGVTELSSESPLVISAEEITPRNIIFFSSVTDETQKLSNDGSRFFVESFNNEQPFPSYATTIYVSSFTLLNSSTTGVTGNATNMHEAADQSIRRDLEAMSLRRAVNECEHHSTDSESEQP